MSKILNRNFLFKKIKICNSLGNEMMRHHLYKINKKNFVYHKKDEVEEFGKTIFYLKF